MQQSSKFKQKESNEIFLTCCLNKILYGLKQISQKWYAILKVYLIFINYQREEIDYSMFIHNNNIIIAIYVNDLLILESNIFDIEALKLQFAERFQMKDLDSIKWYLEMHITRDKAEWTLWINQSIYIKRVIKLLSMSDCSSTKTLMHHRCQLKKNVYTNNVLLPLSIGIGKKMFNRYLNNTKSEYLKISGDKISFSLWADKWKVDNIAYSKHLNDNLYTSLSCDIIQILKSCKHFLNSFIDDHMLMKQSI